MDHLFFRTNVFCLYFFVFINIFGFSFPIILDSIEYKTLKVETVLGFLLAWRFESTLKDLTWKGAIRHIRLYIFILLVVNANFFLYYAKSSN